MKTQLQLTVFIVYFGLVFVHVHDGNGYQLWKKTLQTGVSEGQNVFNNMKDELGKVQNANVRRRRNSVHGKGMRKRETNTQSPNEGFTKEFYVFPEIKDGDALQPSLDLIQSQIKYHTEMERIYKLMEQKNPESHYLHQLRALITNAGMTMNIDLEVVQEYIEFGVPDAETKRQPWCGTCSHSIINTWRKLKEWNLKMRDEGLDAEIDLMDAVVSPALAEMEIYNKYADIFYEQMKTTTEEPDSGSQMVEENVVRVCNERQNASADEMYIETLKQVLILFMTEQSHITEMRYQDEKLATTLMDENIKKLMDKANELMGKCMKDIQDILMRDNVTYKNGVRVEPITPEIFAKLASIFKDMRSYFEERIPQEETREPMVIIREQVQAADIRFHESYQIVKEMINSTTIPWS